MSKLWGGRFSKETDKLVDDFNSSIRFDCRMFEQDIKGSIAHATMLGKCGIIPQADGQAIVKELNNILLDIQSGNVEFTIDAEDIHMNIEKILIDRIGETGKKLHTGRSRNDQVALDLRMYLRDETKIIISQLKTLLQTIVTLAEQHINTIMPGYTHLQKAQPITLAHYLMAYYEMFKRDYDRLHDCYKRINIMPLGSGALAGTTYPLDRELVAQLLEFDGVTHNSLDGVSDRDFALELCFDLSTIMMHLSRISEEMILWNTNEFGFIELDDAYSTGSSIMPQKKNPDVAELTRGKAGRVYGDLMSLLTMMKGLPLAYNKDMQEDKEQIFDAVDTVKQVLPVFTNMLSSTHFRTDVMKKGAAQGFTNATDLADYLVKCGIPFRSAHEIVGKMVAKALSENKALDDFTLEEMKEFSPMIQQDIFDAISLETCVNDRKVIGAPAPSCVASEIDNAKKTLNI